MTTCTDEHVALWSKPVPRYTSYPTATVWKDLSSTTYAEVLKEKKTESFSCYLHIPFCSKICHYCGCTTTACTNIEHIETYVQTLIQEIKNSSAFFTKRPTISSIHLGGGTPTSLSLDQLAALFHTLSSSFPIAKDPEISIEIDPRSLGTNPENTLKQLQKLGITRMSIGVQDFLPAVQQAIGRNQQEETVVLALRTMKDIGIHSVNFDIVYGLPKQTVSSFAQTISKVISLRPERLALFPFAYMPTIFSHQKNISLSDLPCPQEMLIMYQNARKMLLDHGYLAIGMDHFALPTDTLAQAKHHLHRNFQGYTTDQEVIGFGYSAISSFTEGFFQRPKDFATYEKAVALGHAPTARGMFLSEEDRIRKFVIEELMCHGRVDKKKFFALFNSKFDEFFLSARKKIQSLVKFDIIRQDDQSFGISSDGWPYIRHVASCFDATYNL